MSARTALNKDLIMRRVSRGHRHQGHTTTSSTPPTTTDNDANAHSPYERFHLPAYMRPLSLLIVPIFLLSSDVRTSAVFSDVFARVESGFDHFRTVTQDHDARLAAAISPVDKEIGAAMQLLCSLLARRNALAPISLLPPEILARSSTLPRRNVVF